MPVGRHALSYLGRRMSEVQQQVVVGLLANKPTSQRQK